MVRMGGCLKLHGQWAVTAWPAWAAIACIVGPVSVRPIKAALATYQAAKRAARNNAGRKACPLCLLRSCRVLRLYSCCVPCYACCAPGAERDAGHLPGGV